MIRWNELERVAPGIAATGRRLLELNEVAFLATVSSEGRPHGLLSEDLGSEA